MSSAYTWVVPGSPHPWSVYIPGHAKPTQSWLRMKQWQETIQAFFKVNWDKSPMDGPLALDISFFLPIPDHAPVKEPARSEWIGKHMVKPPDVSNMVKAFEDGCKRFLFLDDAQVTFLVASKSFCDGPVGYTYVRVTKVMEEEDP